MSSRGGSKSRSNFIASPVAQHYREIERGEQRALPFAVDRRSAAVARTRPAALVISSAPVSSEFARQPLDHPSKRIEKRDELLLLRLGQIEKAVGDVLGLAFVPLDRVLKGQRLMVMHKTRPRAQSPKGRRAQFVSGILRPSLDDAVAGLDVMQQKVAKGMDDLVAQRRWYREGPAIDPRARRRRRDGRNMTVTAANPLEQPLTGLGICAGRQFGITRRGLRPADKLRKMVDIGQT